MGIVKLLVVLISFFCLLAIVFATLPAMSSQESAIPNFVISSPEIYGDGHTRVLAQGLFPDNCHRVGPSSVKLDLSSRRIAIRSLATYSNAKPSCKPALVSYTKIIDLGILPEGRYDLIFVGENGLHRNLGQISAAPTEIR